MVKAPRLVSGWLCTVSGAPTLPAETADLAQFQEPNASGIINWADFASRSGNEVLFAHPLMREGAYLSQSCLLAGEQMV